MTKDIKLVRYDISERDLTKLSTDQKAMFAILCLVLSEVEALRKVLALGSGRPSGLTELDQAEISQRTVFIRLISMKLIEVFKTLMLDGKYNQSTDVELNSFKDDHVKSEFNKLKKLPGYREALDQRKMMGFHFDLRHFRALSELPDVHQNHSAFVNGDIAFSAFPYGEILVAAAYGRDQGEFEHSEAVKKIEQQTAFIQSQMQAFTKLFQAFFDKFIEPIVSSSDGKIRAPASLVCRRYADPFPLFVLEEETS